MITTIQETFLRFLDLIFYEIISPFFHFIGHILDVVILGPLRFVNAPPMVQMVLVAMLTAIFCFFLRHLFQVEKKEHAFQKVFLKQKAQRDELHHINNWKTREQLAKTMDNEMDERFNTYLADRFVRYGLVYLLPMFLILFWVENSIGTQAVIILPAIFKSPLSLPSLVIFLTSYLITLIILFKKCKQRLKSQEKR